MSLTTLFSNTPSTSPAPPAKVRSSRAWILPTALLLGFIGIFVVLFSEKFLPTTEVRSARVLMIRDSSAHSTSAPNELLFQASGWLEPDPYAIQVPTLVNGIVAEVHVLTGESVTKGQLLATLVDDEAKLALQRAERRLTTIRSQVVAHCSQVPEAKARIESAQATVKAERARLAELSDQATRLRNLPEGAVSVGEVATANLQEERQRAMLLQAESEIPRIEAELETIDYQRLAMGNVFLEAETERDLAKLTLERHQVKAPLDGRILHLHALPGAKRMRDMDDPKSATIVEIYRPEDMQARIDIPLNEAAGLAIGQPVELTTELLSDLTLIGTVTSITGEADLQRNTLQAKVAITNPDDRLRPEMLVRARFFPKIQIADSPQDQAGGGERLVIFAPEDSLFETTGTTAKVWVVDTESKATLRTVTLGKNRRENFREVRDGIRAGEQVILPPFEPLEEGARLNPQLTEL